MTRSARVLLALVLAVFASTAFAAAPSVQSESGFKVTGGSLKAIVGGKTVIYKVGDIVPAKVEVVAQEDAKVSTPNGLTLSVRKDSAFMAAMTTDNLVDVRATVGSVNVMHENHTTVISAGSEINASSRAIKVIAGSADTSYRGGGFTHAGINDYIDLMDMGASDLTKLYTAGDFTSILPPSPTQQSSVVSPSAPGR